MKVPAASLRIRELPRSGVRETMEIAGRTEGVIRLDIGDPDFDTPEHIVEAAVRSARDGFTHYGPASGLPVLRELIAARVGSSPEQVVVTIGACGALLRRAARPPSIQETRCSCPTPAGSTTSRSSVRRVVQRVRYRLDRASGFEPDADEIAERIGPRTRAIVINSPGNPTGAVFSRTTLEAVLELAERRGVWVLSDECYEDLVLEGEHASALADAARIAAVHSFSKTYAMTGWRVGYAVVPPEVAPLVALAQEAIVSPSTGVQKAAEAALAGPQEPVVQMRRAYRSRRDVVLAPLDVHGVPYVRPRSAFYLMVDVSRGGEPSREFARRALLEERVTIVPGSAFGAATERMVRLSLTQPEETIATAVDRLVASLEKTSALT